MIPKLYTPVALPDPLELFGQMLAQSPFAVWLADKSGKVILFNEAMRNLVNIEDPDAVLASYNIFEDPVARSQGLVPYIRRVLDGQVIETVVMLDLGREDFNASSKTDPEVFYVRCQYFPLKGEDGAFDYVVQVVENITQQYLEDLDLSGSARELEAADVQATEIESEISALKSRVETLKTQLSTLKQAV